MTSVGPNRQVARRHADASALVPVRDVRSCAGPHSATVFDRYTLDRKGEHLRAHPKKLRSKLQAGANAWVAKLYGDRVVEVA